MSKPCTNSCTNRQRDSLVDNGDDDFDILQIVQMRLQGNSIASQSFVLPRQERHVHGNNQTEPCSSTTTSAYTPPPPPPPPPTPSATTRPEIQQDATTLLAECQKTELEPETTPAQPPRPRIPGAYAVEGLGTGDEVGHVTEAGENGDDVVAHPVNEDNDLQSGELQNAEPLIFSRRTRIYWRQRLETGAEIPSGHILLFYKRRPLGEHHGWLDWDTNECDWELIFLWGKVDSPELHCNDKGEIKGLEFGHTNNLEGTLPPEISLLGNSLQALGFLREFQLEGTIPTKIGLLTKLTRLELGAAALSGTVPTEFGCLQSLEQLVMSSGSLPSELGKLGNLTIFKVVNTDLTGSLPVEVCRMHQLTQIVVIGSPGLFSESLLPEIIRNMPRLQLLVLDQRKSGDKMPLLSWFLCTAEIGMLSELDNLHLVDWKIDGTVPKQLGHLTDLKFLTLKGNSIAGTMHSELFDLTNLISLDIEANQMKGSLPRMLFSKLTNLQYLRIN
ncbi:LRR receptor-like serine threonine-protein kinase [Seminavis robusta]|uniref:LRR receptor-like serine threonine-protein kinase n=1 Tax=Seminavis robusta TaxID=568900 RepID=A0A9N8F470_9STRA|nr:LRR receptor-like serine threonine-protein kinase [Seminavis robusta]|eukprot:Sro3299_g346370.1 LRR receptor-like serine threonine-protein kinase (501) ;mRNA; r:590-2798